MIIIKQMIYEGGEGSIRFWTPAKWSAAMPVYHETHIIITNIIIIIILILIIINISSALRCSNSQVVQISSPILHLDLSVSNCSKPFNNYQTRPPSWGYLGVSLAIILGIHWG